MQQRRAMWRKLIVQAKKKRFPDLLLNLDIYETVIKAIQRTKRSLTCKAKCLQTLLQLMMFVFSPTKLSREGVDTTNLMILGLVNQIIAQYWKCQLQH